jgi:hypothetical protein
MICRLCNKKAKLRASHIISDFFGKGGGTYYPTGKDGHLQPFTQPLHTTPGKRFERKQKGYWERQLGQVEYLLCHECEQKISTLEDYVKKFFYGKSHPIRLQLPLKEDSFFKADYRKIKLFQLSILWRAEVAKGSFFSMVQFSEKYREELRQMLLAGDPGSEDRYPCGMAQLTLSPQMNALLAQHGGTLEAMLFAPVAHNHGSWISFTFIMGGLSWIFCVSDSGAPKIMKNTYIKENGSFFLSNFSAGKFLIEFSEKAKRSGNLTWADVESNRKAKKGRA